MLSDISKALEATGKPVYYGKAPNVDGGEVWDYIVFFRTTLGLSTNKTGVTERFTVAIVQEEYVETETINAVIEAMTGIPGVRLSNEDPEFDYAAKPNTDTVIEILTIGFVRPNKGVKVNV